MRKWLERTASAVAASVAAVIASMALAGAFTLIVAHTERGLAYKVNAQHAHQFIGFVHDLEHTYGPIKHLGCYSKWGHVAFSQHHVGNACDIEQYGWGRTSYQAMYRIGWLARKHGLRDGCSFGDCGHVDTGGPGWANGGPPGMVAQAEIPATRTDNPNVGRNLEWPVTLASTELKPVKLATKPVPTPKMKHASLAKVHHQRFAYIWRAVSDGDRCVNLGQRLMCVQREKVKLRG